MDPLTGALAWWDGGCSVVRVALDGSKRPLGSWKDYQAKRAERRTAEGWFRDGHPGVGVICGAVSGHLEMFELEGRAVDEGVQFELGEACDELEIGDLWRTLTETCAEQSPSGGIHVFYRVPSGVTGNTKLAQRLARDDELLDEERALQKRGKKIVRGLIETRGEGGFVVVAPSAGTVHPTGKPYRFTAGNPATIPTITGEQRDLLHIAAHACDRLPPPPPIPDVPQRTLLDDDDLSPGDDYNRRGSWAELLEPHGWHRVWGNGTRTYWRRPGKASGVSAVTGGDRGDYFFAWTTSTELPSEEAMSKWRVYAVLEHRGDFRAAARELSRTGYGRQPPPPRATTTVTATTSPHLAPGDEKIGTNGHPEDPDRVVRAVQEAVEAEPDSWEPIDLGPYLDGTIVRSKPSIGLGRKRDGLRLLYPGKEHSVIGEMECGKSWYALASAAVELNTGRHVIYIHFEEADPGDSIERLRLLGVIPEVIRERFHFVAPAQRATAERLSPLIILEPSLVVLDGVNEAMSLHGQKIMDPEGAAEYRRRLVKPFTKYGAAVISCDHVTKDPERRGRYSLGSVHKGNGLDGALIIMETAEPFGREKKGRSHVYVAKDRPGHLRRHGKATSIPGKTYMGEFVVDDTQTFSPNLVIGFYAPKDDVDVPQGVDPNAEFDQKIFDAVKEIIDSWVEASMNRIRAKVGGRKSSVDDAVERLVMAGRLVEIAGKRNARIFILPSGGS